MIAKKNTNKFTLKSQNFHFQRKHRLRRSLTFFITWFLVTGPIFAGTFAGILEVNNQESSIEFSAIGNPSMLTIEGKGNGPEGKLIFSKDGIKGNLELDLKSLNTGIELRDQHMKEKYLEVNKGDFKKAILKLTKLNITSDEVVTQDKVSFEGILKLHGVEKPIRGEGRIEKKGKSFKAEAPFEINLQDFQIQIPSYAGITVGETVKIKATIVGTLLPADTKPAN